jgi:hypothetical protein
MIELAASSLAEYGRKQCGRRGRNDANYNHEKCVPGDNSRSGC